MGNYQPCLRRGCGHDQNYHKGGSGVCTRCQCFQYALGSKPAYERLR